MTTRPVPLPDPETKVFWDSARAERLSIQRCADCGVHQFYPRLVCHACLSDRLDWVPASGHGTIYSFTVVERAPGAFRDLVPYAVALVDLDEGVRMMTRVRTERPHDLRIGQRVEVCFEDLTEDIALPLFAPAGIGA
jgi:uncharacterized protein